MTLGFSIPRTILDRKLLAGFMTGMLTFATMVHACAEEACGLKQYASLDMITLANGEIAVAAEIDGKPVTMAVSVSFPYSYVLESYAPSSDFPRHSLRSVMIILGGKLVYERLTVPSLTLGGARMKNVEMLSSYSGSVEGTEAVGALGVDVLSRFDVEIDFSKRKINLFSPDRCAGKVVYWSDSYAAAPLDLDIGGHPSVQMDLDGKPVKVEFDLESGSGSMGMKTAERIFDINPSNPGVSPLTNPANGKLRGYRFPFKLLSIPGISVSRPDIFLDPGRQDCPGHQTATLWHTIDQCFGTSDVTLGMEELKQLHLYIAYKEKMLYVTPAGAGPEKSP